MIIVCDVDGIIAALHDEWYSRYNRDYEDNLTLDRVKSWDVHKYVKPECGKKIYEYLNAPDLYDNIQPIEGAVAGVRSLREMGHELVFTSDCFFGMTDAKAHWLNRHGFSATADPRGASLPGDFIVARAKNRLDGHLMIDDGGHNIKAWVEEKRRKAIMMEYPHNQYLLDEVPSAFWEWCVRVRDWKQILHYFETL